MAKFTLSPLLNNIYLHFGWFFNVYITIRGSRDVNWIGNALNVCFGRM